MDNLTIVSSTHRPTVLYWRLSDFKMADYRSFGKIKPMYIKFEQSLMKSLKCYKTYMIDWNWIELLNWWTVGKWSPIKKSCYSSKIIGLWNWITVMHDTVPHQKVWTDHSKLLIISPKVQCVSYNHFLPHLNFGIFFCF